MKYIIFFVERQELEISPVLLKALQNDFELSNEIANYILNQNLYPYKIFQSKENIVLIYSRNKDGQKTFNFDIFLEDIINIYFKYKIKDVKSINIYLDKDYDLKIFIETINKFICLFDLNSNNNVELKIY